MNSQRNEIVHNVVLSKTLKDFSLATNFGSVLVDIKGKENSDLFNFSPFCQLMRLRPECHKLCQNCDAFGGLEASKNGKPYIYRCHAGLTDISLPIIYQNQLHGFILFGQAELTDTSAKFNRIHPVITKWQTDPELRQARNKVRVVSTDQIHSAASILDEITNYHFSKFESENPRDRIKFNYKTSTPQRKHYSSNPEIRKALTFIQQNLTCSLTLEDVANHVFLSQYYFSRLFKKEMGTTFVTYVNQLRVEQGKEMLKTSSLSIQTIAHSLGYSQTSYFCKIFKEIEGVTPANYRKTVK